MEFQRTWHGATVDGHVHMGPMDEESVLLDIMGAAGIGQAALASIQDPQRGAGLGGPLMMKARHPRRFYVFAGPNHALASAPSGSAVPLAEQVGRLLTAGCDGIKMIDGKPTSRRTLNVPVSAPYFADYWEAVESLDLPLIWHVGDPEEFWDPSRAPGWAVEQDWCYGPEDVPLEQLYAEVDEVLERHPRLRVSFAHFYFLSADLRRAARFLDAHPTVRFDLAPGIEMLYNTSRNPDAARDFFIRYSDRIIFGTDIFTELTVAEALARAGIVQRWLETEDEFRVPPEADFLLGPPTDGVIRGLALPDGVLERIYQGNFADLAGTEPRPIELAAAADLCHAIAGVAEALSGTPASQTEAGHAAQMLEAMA